MDYRQATLWPRANYTTDKTEIIDIDVADCISRISIYAEVDNNSTGDPDADDHPMGAITKVEVVDGSDVLYSLTGMEGQAIDFYDTEKEPVNRLNYLNGNYSRQVLNINFGRFLYDPDLAFDPTRFRNPQLKVSIDVVGGGGWNSNDVYLTAIAHLFDEKSASPAGFLMCKEIKDYTMGSASHEYTDLPLDFPYRNIFLRGRVKGTYLPGVIDTVKISQDVDRKVPLNNTMYEILYAIGSQWKKFKETCVIQGQTTAIKGYITPTVWTMGGASPYSADAAYSYVQFYTGTGRGGEALFDASVAGRNVQAIYAGWAPHAVVPLLPKLDMMNKDGYPVTGMKSLKLDVLSITGMSTNAQIIAQQFRKY